MGRREGKRPFGRGVPYRGLWWGYVSERDRLEGKKRTGGFGGET